MASRLFNTALLVSSFALIVATITFSVPQLQAKIPDTYKDAKFVGIMKEVSTSIPTNATMLASADAPVIQFLTNRTTVTAYTIAEGQSISDYMARKQIDYLIVLEGKSIIPELAHVFRKESLPDLSSEFNLLLSEASESFVIHLYSIKPEVVESIRNKSGFQIDQYAAQESEIAH